MEVATPVIPPAEEVRSMMEAIPVRYPALWTAASLGRKEEVRKLLAQDPDLEERGGPMDSTPLEIAVLSGHGGVARQLLEAGAEMSAKDGEGLPKDCPTTWKRVIEGAPPVLPLALWTASSCGKTEKVRQLIAQDPDLEETSGARESTPLYEAALEGHFEVVKLLLKAGADAACTTNNGWTALHVAAYQGREKAALLLLQHGAEVSAAHDDGGTPLHYAAAGGHEAVVQLLIAHGADVSAENNDGGTPLNLAQSRGHQEVVRLLLLEA
jgi:ankyrin repeat protein